MVFTRREKLIIAATIAAVCLLLLDAYVLTPLLDQRNAVKARKEKLAKDLAQDEIVLKRRRLLGGLWRRMQDGGLKNTPEAAESQLLWSLRGWSSAVGVKLSSQRLERSTDKTEMPEIIMHVAGTGTMQSISRLLLRIETAEVPVKIRMVQLGTRKDGTDNLSMQLKLSTLYLPDALFPQKEIAGRAGTTGGGG